MILKLKVKSLIIERNILKIEQTKVRKHFIGQH